MQTVVRIWFLATAFFLAGAMIWVFVPVLVPMIGLTVGLAALVAVIVSSVRRLERWRRQPDGHVK
ncbi:MAG: hypothetical protein R3D67_09230 [Hyphomicrobiaceae bacterium]